MNADEMAGCLLNACEVFWTNPEAWQRLQKQAMAEDFSWRRAAEDYLDLYHQLHPDVVRYNKRRD
jgi:starch synthase